MGDDGDFQWDWDNDSIPLEPCGAGPPKFIGPSDKHSANEGDNAFLSFQVEGNPAPEVKWFKGFKDLAVEPRYKFYTDGSRNLAILGVSQCRSDEEGDYRVVLTNEHGEEEFEFKFFVTVEGGMDFRAMLMKRKKPQKKVVVKKPEWLEQLIEQDVQEGKCDKVVFTAKLSEKEKPGKWYLMNSAAMGDVRAQEYGLQLYKDNKDKYEITAKDDWYSLTILNPCVTDAGKYTLVVRLEKDQIKTGAYLNVASKDPEYCFKKRMSPSQVGYTARTVVFKCQLNEEGAKVQWTKGAKQLKNGDLDGRVAITQTGTKLCLAIDNAIIDDLGIYSCQIMEFVKKGEEACTDCELVMEEYPHKFTSKLKGQKVIEHDRCEFEIDVEADDAEVSWYHNGVKIVPDDKRVSIVTEGKKRKLVIKDTLLADSGEISVRTNVDKSAANLKVAYNNRFLQELPHKVEAVEREPVSVNVEVKDPDAPVTFYIAGKKVTPSDDRCEVKNLGNGLWNLTVNHCKMSDLGTLEARTPSNRGDEVVSSCTFEVEKGEEAPQLGDCGPVTGIAHKDCSWKMDFHVEGKQQSPMEIIVMKDGKELKLGQHVNVQVAGDSINLSVINPRREKSGVYTVIVKNAQGQSERDIMVNIMDKPSPPESCKVSDVFYDNCIVHWTPPKDDGGTEIKKYIVEALDVSSGMEQWSEVAETQSGGERKIKVEKLTHRHRYRFRVRAANKLGKSDPTEMLGDDIWIKDPWDEPSPPGKPNIEDWGPDRCDLSWIPPETDGGAEIRHYDIEFMELHGEMGIWEHGISIPAKDLKVSADGLLHGRCPGLQEGQEYVFRVKAVNKGGPSLPSPQSESMIAKTRYIKPFLHQPGMYDIEIKKGRTFRYDIWFGGEPPPTVTWERNGLKVEPNERTSIEMFCKKTVYCERNSVLTVVKSERAVDGGLYKIRLVCDAGTFEATGYVNVLDVPEKPRNLTLDEVRAEHVKISWAVPEDDGGTPITGYVVRVLDLEGGEWMTVAETKPNALNAAIKGLKPGHLYQLEVCAINREGVGPPVRTKDPIKAENPYEPPSPPKEPYITDFDNQSVTLRWSKPQSDGGRPITHYIVQKKDKFGGWFDALVTDDSNCCAIIDELEARIPGLSEGKWYQFRVVAVNKAGESWPSCETKPHLCRHKNLKPSIDHGAAGSKSVKVNRSAIWHIKCKGEPPPKFLWYKDGHLLQSSGAIQIQSDEYQGGATALLQIVKSQMSDAGCYTLVAENRNGKDKIDLDLVVLDLMHDPECEMFKTGSLECRCSSGFRESDLTTEQILEINFA